MGYVKTSSSELSLGVVGWAFVAVAQIPILAYIGTATLVISIVLNIYMYPIAQKALEVTCVPASMS